MRTVLVTGGHGALARSVCACLNSLGGYRVVVSTRTGGDDGVVELDVCDPVQFATRLEQFSPQIVLHLAATFTDDFAQAYSVNVDSTRHLLEAVEKLGSPVRVILAGSAAEYGIVRPEENPVSEARVLNPVSVYGLTKAWQTQLAYLYAARGVDVIVARIFNLEGSGLSERLFAGRILRQIEGILQGQRSTIEVGSLGATRDYLKLDEAAEQIAAVLACGRAGEVYHIASGKPVTMRALLERNLDEHGIDVGMVREASNLSNKVGYDVPAIYADVTKTTTLLESWRALGKA
ncbi:NAD(P)-dependent oxidoreductase [Paraburkholderia sp. Cy-641]|uniref:NAD-dependent epimerase/dehydratase family protein n=1 Tax=Paraburkholderia sp. Cy-641 TaxID=2608337 RepID=UPI001420EAFF|nr:NAD(P)-dependent oxidoreductase [Paraburkholderia sp. Cy-641]NIF76623.1 NAD(P)-dependent oxidoreductase [Paraburkholderia sp. Cy-641]